MLGFVLPVGSAVLGAYDFARRWARVAAITTGVLMAARYVWRPR